MKGRGASAGRERGAKGGAESGGEEGEKRAPSRKNRIRSIKRLLDHSTLPKGLHDEMVRELKSLEHKVRECESGRLLGGARL
jgi:hypothetical protein